MFSVINVCLNVYWVLNVFYVWSGHFCYKLNLKCNGEGQYLKGKHIYSFHSFLVYHRFHMFTQPASWDWVLWQIKRFFDFVVIMEQKKHRSTIILKALEAFLPCLHPIKQHNFQVASLLQLTLIASIFCRFTELQACDN